MAGAMQMAIDDQYLTVAEFRISIETFSDKIVWKFICSVHRGKKKGNIYIYRILIFWLMYMVTTFEHDDT
jgi:hypothetical protein